MICTANPLSPSDGNIKNIFGQAKPIKKNQTDRNYTFASLWQSQQSEISLQHHAHASSPSVETPITGSEQKIADMPNDIEGT